VKKNSQLKKELGTLAIFSIASGAMISSGLFILPALLYRTVGPSIILSYFIAAILVVPAMFSKAELATAMPKSGGTYFFIYRSFGPLFGTFAGFASWFSLSLKSSFALLGIGIFLEPLLHSYTPEMAKAIAVGCTIIFMVINTVGVKEGAKLQVVLVMGLLAILICYILGGLNFIDVQRYVPFRPGGWWPILTSTGMVFVSFGGLTKVASIAEEIRDPHKTIVRGMFSALVVVVVLYIGTVFVTTGLLDKVEFSTTLMPISLGASKFAGNIGMIMLAAAGMIAFITTGNAGLMTASRNPLAMAQDNLLPSFFSYISVRFKTPIVALSFTSLFMITVMVFLDLEALVKVASTMMLILFSLVNLSVILMRESKIVSYKPTYYAPFYPWLQIGGSLIYITLIIEMGRIPLLITLGFFILSLCWYLLFSKSRIIKDSALIHIVERVTSREIRSSGLTDELKEILMKRDQIIEDRFDHLMKNAAIQDVPKSISHEELFHIISETFAERLSEEAGNIFQLLQKRESDSTTVIHEGLAIPHIIVKGSGKFDIAIFRSRDGFRFNGKKVHIVFALAGSIDERTFHLKALMAIAQIVQNKNFIDSWMKAKDAAELRNLILLAERIRSEQL